MTTPRIDLEAKAARQYATLVGLERSLQLDRRVRELVNLRVSQINGCTFCIDVHRKRARGGGESEERLRMLRAWRDSTLFDERERTALALCEAITRISEDGVSDGVWGRAAEQSARTGSRSSSLRSQRSMR